MSKVEMEVPKADPPPSPAPSKESLRQRYKPIVRFFLVFNLGLAGYIFVQEHLKKKKASAESDKRASEDKKADVQMEPLVSPPVVKVREPIPEEQQRQLFQWILEEKRKLKPKDKQQKKQIDEEKAILKHFINAESIPQL